MQNPDPLPLSFYARDALWVAWDLIGCELEHAVVRLKITEVEAYRFPNDTANHARFGKTPRNAPMWGPPGHAYIYLCYGMHLMLNLTTNAPHQAAAVLIRAAEPVSGLPLIQQRRGGKTGPVLLTGPGKVGESLALQISQSGMPLNQSLFVYPRSEPPKLLHGPRIGIGYASKADQEAPWRIAMANNKWVSFPKGLVQMS